MSRYLDPKSDLVFKTVFEHPRLLKSFLNALLPLEEGHLIESLTYLPTEQVPAIPVLKRTIVDIKCTDQQKKQFIVEMQVEWTPYFMQRLLFGTSQAYVKQLERGQDYHLLKPVYGVALLATCFDKETTEWYHHYKLVNTGIPERAIKGLQLLFVELPKFTPASHQKKQLKTLWLRFLSEINEATQEAPQELLEVPEIAEAITLAQTSSYTPAQLASYELHWDTVSTEKTLMEGKFREGKTEGRVEGKAEGKAEIVWHMHAQGFDPETIANMTKLSLDEVQKILSA